MKAINELHSDTRILINFLELNFVKEGKTELTYSEISSAINRDTQNEARGCLSTARKHVEKEHGITIEPIFGVGLKKTSDYVGVMDRSARKIRRGARYTAKRILNVVSSNNLPDEQVKQVNARLSILGAIAMFSSSNSAKKLDGKIEELGNKELPTSQTLEFFK